MYQEGFAVSGKEFRSRQSVGGRLTWRGFGPALSFAGQLCNKLTRDGNRFADTGASMVLQSLG